MNKDTEEAKHKREVYEKHRKELLQKRGYDI